MAYEHGPKAKKGGRSFREKKNFEGEGGVGVVAGEIISAWNCIDN